MRICIFISGLKGLKAPRKYVTLTGGGSGASLDGFSPVARGVHGPLTITLPMY